MSETVIAPHAQRRFLMTAFHPYGSDVCSLLGLPLPSLDVDEAERRAAMQPWGVVLGELPGMQCRSDLTAVQVLAFAQLYHEGAASLINARHPQYHRALSEDLVSFFIALIGSGGTQ